MVRCASGVGHGEGHGTGVFELDFHVGLERVQELSVFAHSRSGRRTPSRRIRVPCALNQPQHGVAGHVPRRLAHTSYVIK